MRKLMFIPVMVAGALLPAVGSADTLETMARNLARFERHAGPPVEEIRNFRMSRWRPLGERELALWAKPGDVYLVRLEGPCIGFEFASTIHVTSTQRVVTQRFDAVEFDRQHCTIRSIQRVDYKALRRDGDD